MKRFSESFCSLFRSFQHAVTYIMRFLVPLLLMVSSVVGVTQEVSYVRYYGNEQDFLKGIRLPATERMRSAHIRCLYDREDRVLSKAHISASGIVVQEEIYEYDARGNLVRRSIRDASGNAKKMYVYGDDEEISNTFIAYAFPNRSPKEFRDRVTTYDYLSDGHVKGYYFRSVDDTDLGAIHYEYFDSGLVKEERWIKQPGNKTIRLFSYQYEPKSRHYELTEYDSTGTRISQVRLVLPPETDRQRSVPTSVKTPSPVSKNILEESSEIIEDILRRNPDIIYLKRGDTLHVDILKITATSVRFKLHGQQDMLTMPLSSVGEIERRDGEIIYPIIY